MKTIMATIELLRGKRGAANLNIREITSLPLIYYPPEVSNMKYCCLGVLRKNTSGLSLTGANRKSH